MITLISLIHHGAGENGKRLETTLRERFLDIEHEFYDSSGSFYQRLCQPNIGLKQEIYMILADSMERLEKIMGLKNLLEGKRLVLILPGSQKEVLSMGHRLLPRYVSCEMKDHEELFSVLEKMVQVLNGAKKNKIQ